MEATIYSTNSTGIWQRGMSEELQKELNRGFSQKGKVVATTATAAEAAAFVAATTAGAAAAPKAEEGVCAKALKMLSDSNLGRVWNAKELHFMEKFFVEMFPALGADLVNLVLSPFVKLVNLAASKKYSPYMTTIYTSTERLAQRDATVKAYINDVVLSLGSIDPVVAKTGSLKKTPMQKYVEVLLKYTACKLKNESDVKKKAEILSYLEHLLNYNIHELNHDKNAEIRAGLEKADTVRTGDDWSVTALKVATSAACYTLPCLAAGACIPAVGAILLTVGTGAVARRGLI